MKRYFVIGFYGQTNEVEDIEGNYVRYEDVKELKILSNIGQAYQWAYENGIVTINPMSLVMKFMESNGNNN